MQYTAILIKVVPEQSGKFEYEREKLAGRDDQKYTNKQNLKMLEAKPGFIINCVNVLWLKRFIY